MFENKIQPMNLKKRNVLNCVNIYIEPEISVIFKTITKNSNILE